MVNCSSNLWFVLGEKTENCSINAKYGQSPGDFERLENGKRKQQRKSKRQSAKRSKCKDQFSIRSWEVSQEGLSKRPGGTEGRIGEMVGGARGAAQSEEGQGSHAGSEGRDVFHRQDAGGAAQDGDRDRPSGLGR